MKNYYSINISYLRKQEYKTREEFAKVFGVTKEIIGAYENDKKKFVDLELFNNICNHFRINLDIFVNTDLSKKTPKNHFVEEPTKPYTKTLDSKTVAMYDKVIKNYEDLLATKNDLLKEKDNSMVLKDKIIEGLEKDIEKTNILFNQSGVDISDTLVHKIATLIKVNAALEEAKQKQKNTQN